MAANNEVRSQALSQFHDLPKYGAEDGFLKLILEEKQLMS